MCLDSTVVLRVGTDDLFVEGSSSEVDGCFCSSTRCVNAQGPEPAPVSGPQFHELGCRESAIHQGRHGVAQRRFDLAGSVSARNPGVADMIVTEMGQADAGWHLKFVNSW